MSSRIIKNYTLVEVLLVVSLLLIFFGGSIDFFYKGQKACTTYSDAALANRQAALIRKAWRSFIHDKEEPYMTNEKEIIFDDDASIKIAGKKMIFESKNLRKEYDISVFNDGYMSSEENQDEQASLVLVLSYKPKYSDSVNLKNDYIRILAAYGKTGNKAR